MSKSNKSFSKFLVYMSGAIGLSILGLHLYNKKIKRDNQLNSLEKHMVKNELKTLVEAEYTFIDILLNEDSDVLRNNEIESVFELNSIQYALDIYHISRDFRNIEIKNIIRVWLLNNVKTIEMYIGKIEKEELIDSMKKLDKLSNNLSKTLKTIDMYDELAEDEEIQEYVVKTYAEIKKGLENNNPIARHIFNLNI